MSKRKDELNEIFKDIDENQRKLIDPLLDEFVFLEEQMISLKKLPFIRVNPDNPEIQQTTKAAKLYKETSQSYMNAVRILCSLLHKVDGIEDDPVAKFMESLNQDVR